MFAVISVSILIYGLILGNNTCILAAGIFAIAEGMVMVSDSIQGKKEKIDKKAVEEFYKES